MQAAATELAPLPADPALSARLTVSPRRTARDRRMAAAVGGLAIVGATTSMAMASQSALPGDTLYPLKRAIENAHTSVSMGDADKGATLLGNARGRLAEVAALTQQSDVDGSEIAATLGDFSTQATQASQLLLDDYAQNEDDASISALRSFASRSLAALDDVSALVPESARPALVKAADVLVGIDDDARRACPQCSGQGIDRFPTWMLTSSADLRDLITKPLPSAGASVTQVGPKGGTSPLPSVPSNPIDLGGDGGSPLPGTGTPSGTPSQDPLGGLTGGLTGGNGGGKGSGASTDPLDGVLDDVTGLLDPDGDGVLGTSSGSSSLLGN